jgi:hypothetical protein
MDKANNIFVRTKTGSAVHASRSTSSRTDCGLRHTARVRPTLTSSLCERCFGSGQIEFLKAVSAMFCPTSR